MIPTASGGGMENYIIRIYRRARDDRRMLVGLVEKVGRSGRKAFNTLDDLWEILNPKVGKTKTSRRNRKGLRSSRCAADRAER
jgi:hypothetical protein